MEKSEILTHINYGRLLGFPISNEGKEQANATAEYFQKKVLHFMHFTQALNCEHSKQLIL